MLFLLLILRKLTYEMNCKLSATVYIFLTSEPGYILTSFNPLAIVCYLISVDIKGLTAVTASSPVASISSTELCLILEPEIGLNLPGRGPWSPHDSEHIPPIRRLATPFSPKKVIYII